MDYDIHRAARHCAASGREFQEGETFYSVLVAEGASCRRLDYAADAWQGPPEQGLLGWWKSRMPSREAKKARLAPNEVLLEYFNQLSQGDGDEETLYVLALLLVRRRVFRLEDTEQEAGGDSVLVLYCPRDETTHRVIERSLDEQRTSEIQEQLAQLLFADAG